MKFMLKDSLYRLLIAVLLTAFLISTMASAVEVKRIEETDPSFKYSDVCEDQKNPGASGGSWLVCPGEGKPPAPGAKINIMFTGAAVSLIYLTSQNGGIATVQIDGKTYPEIDMYSEKIAVGVKKEIATGLSNTQHVLTLEIANKKTTMLGIQNVAGVIAIDAIEVTAPTPATFIVSNIIINPPKVGVGNPVTISADITNNGEVAGNYSAALKIDETIIETKKVTIVSGATETVTFSPITKNATGTYTVDVGGQTKTLRVLKSAAFTVTNLKISPEEVETGKPVTITVDVMNTGEAKESYSVPLSINNAEEDSTDVSIDGKATEKVSFTVIKSTLGTYNVTIDEQEGTFVVVPLKQPGFTVVFAIVGLLVIVYLYRPKK